MNKTPKEQFDFFWDTFHKSPQSKNVELKTLLEKIYTIEWFTRNGEEVWFGTNWSLTVQFPLSIPSDTMTKKVNNLEDYFSILSRIINSIGLANILSSKSINGLIALNKSFQAYFELKVLTFIKESGFQIAGLDIVTKNKKNVEAKIVKGDWESLIECKVLGLSNVSYEFYSGFDWIEGFIQQCALTQSYFFGELIIKKHFKDEVWKEIFNQIKKVLTGTPFIKNETDDYKLVVQSAPDENYSGFNTKETFPSDERIKSTIQKKTLPKFRGKNKGILICCLPLEVGQGNAVKCGKELLENNKFKNINQIIFINIKHTFKKEHIDVWNIVNPNYNGEHILDWNKTSQQFELIKKTLVRA